MRIFVENDFFKVNLDKDLNILENDLELSGNFSDLILPIFKDEFVGLLSKKRKESFNSSLFINGKIFVLYIEDGYEVVCYKRSAIDMNVIGYFLYDQKTNYIITTEFSGSMSFINEGSDFFKYDNEYNLTVLKDHYTTYVDFLRNAKLLSKSYIQVNYKGEIKWCELRCVYQSEEESNLLHIAFVDVTSSFSSNISYIKKSFKDPLTGVYQRDSIREYINDYIKLYKENQAMFAIIDLDYFKTINDTYGHTFGDIVISKACETFKNVLSKYPDAEIGRIGGDEFLLFVPNVVSRDAVKELASKLRIEIMKISYKEIKSFSMSCTMGISKYPMDGDNFDLLFKKADKALYRGKNKGRDCYIIYDEELHGGIDMNRESINLEEIALNASLQNKRTRIMCRIVSDLYQSNDIEKSIICAIDEFASINNLERIILEYETNLGCIKYSYVSPKATSSGVDDYSVSKIAKYINYFNSEYILSVSNTNTLKFKNIDLQQMYLRFKTNAFTTCLILNDDKLQGYISYEMTSIKRVWQKEEVTNFMMFKEFISFVIEKYIKTYNKLPNLNK